MPQPRRRSPTRKDRRSRSRSPGAPYQTKRRKHPSGPGRSRSRSYSPRLTSRRRSRSPDHARKSQTRKESEAHRYKPSLERSGPRHLSGKRDRSLSPFVAPPRRRSLSPPPKISHRSRSPRKEFEHGERRHSSHRHVSPSEPREFSRADAGLYKSPEQRPSSTTHDERLRFSGVQLAHDRPAYVPPLDTVRQPALLTQLHSESKPQYAEPEPRVVASSSTRDVYTGISSVKIPKSAVRLKSLTTRFMSQDQEYQGPFKYSENITIGIHRHPNIRSSSPVQICRDFNPSNFVMLHKREGGKRPIFDREEVKQFRHDDILDDEPEYVERRVISVVPSEPPRSRHSEFKLPDQDVDYRTGPAPSGSQWSSSEQRRSSSDRRDSRKTSEHDRREVDTRFSKSRRDSSRDTHQQPQIRLDPRPDPRYEELYKQTKEREQRNTYKERIKIEKIQHNPGDLRHNLLRRKPDDVPQDSNFDARKRIEQKRRVSDSFKEPKLHKEHRSERVKERDHGRVDIYEREQRDSSGHRESLRGNISSRSTLGYRGRSSFRGRPGDQRPSRGSSSRDGEMRPDTGDRSSIPDFKNRLDKYQYEEWKENPELIPRGPSYFEHDDREDDELGRPVSRGRGFRGSSTFRPRGFRGTSISSFRGRGRGFGSRGFSARRPFNSRFRGRGRGFSGLSSGGGSGRERDSTRGDWKHDRDSTRDDWKHDRDSTRDDWKHDRDSTRGDWKHDMFDKIEKEEDNKPSSTTKI